MGQDTILRLRSALGHTGLDIFSASKEGICRGVAQTAINAFVLEKALEKEAREKSVTNERQNEFRKYLDRIDFILTNHNHLARFIFDTYRTIKERTAQSNPSSDSIEIDNDEQKILDVAAVIEAMQLFAYPDKYSEIFGKHLTQKDTVEISYYAQPLELEKRSLSITQPSVDTDEENLVLGQINKKSGIIQTDSISGIYTADELNKYISVLLNLIEKSPCDLALAIDNDEHAISIFYDTLTKSWTIIDAENLSKKTVAPDELASRISTALPFTFDPRKAFSTKFFTSVNRKSEMEAFLNELKANQEFIALHEITFARAKMSDLKGVSLAYLAASENNVSLVSALSKLKDTDNSLLVDFNKPIGDGTTPLFMAIQNGSSDAVKLIAGLQKQDRTPCIDFNKAIKTKRGTWTPLFLAAQFDQENVIKVLSELKKLDETFLIDFNQAVDGMPPAFTAAQYGCASAFRTLVELHNPDGTRVIDVKKPMSYGSTCLYISLLRGHTNIVKILAELKNLDGSNVINLNDTIQGGFAAIHITVSEKNLSMLKMLTELKNIDGLPLIDFNKKDPEGYNIIHLAAKNGCTDIMEFLLNTRNTTGIDFTVLNEGLTVAHIAAANNQLEVLKILEKNGIDIEIQTAHKKPIDLATNSGVLYFYKAIDKRKQIIAEFERMKGVKISSLDLENIKSRIFESFYKDHEKFLQSDEFENKLEGFRNSSSQSLNAHSFFYSDSGGQTITDQTEKNKATYIFQMEADINENYIELKFESSRLIKFENISSDPVIWKLSVENDIGKKLNIPINNKILIDKLKTSLSQKDLQACVDILKEQKGRAYRKITKQIEGEIDWQKYQQDANLQI